MTTPLECSICCIISLQSYSPIQNSEVILSANLLLGLKRDNADDHIYVVENTRQLSIEKIRAFQFITAVLTYNIKKRIFVVLRLAIDIS